MYGINILKAEGLEREGPRCKYAASHHTDEKKILSRPKLLRMPMSQSKLQPFPPNSADMAENPRKKLRFIISLFYYHFFK